MHLKIKSIYRNSSFLSIVLYCSQNSGNRISQALDFKIYPGEEPPGTPPPSCLARPVLGVTFSANC